MAVPLLSRQHPNSDPIMTFYTWHPGTSAFSVFVLECMNASATELWENVINQDMQSQEMSVRKCFWHSVCMKSRASQGAQEGQCPNGNTPAPSHPESQ